MISDLIKKISAALLFTLAFAQTALATYGIPEEYQPSNIAESWAEQNPEQLGEAYGAVAVTLIIGDIISGVLGVIGVLAVYFLVSNAFKYVTSFGQQDKLDQAKKGIFWALGGLLIVILSYSIVQTVIWIVLSTDESHIL